MCVKTVQVTQRDLNQYAEFPNKIFFNAFVVFKAHHFIIASNLPHLLCVQYLSSGIVFMMLLGQITYCNACALNQSHNISRPSSFPVPLISNLTEGEYHEYSCVSSSATVMGDSPKSNNRLLLSLSFSMVINIQVCVDLDHISFFQILPEIARMIPPLL